MQDLPSERSRPHALLFDLGNVCLPFDHRRMVIQLAALFEVPPADVQAVLLDSRLLLDIECGRVSDDELHRSLCVRFGREVTQDDLFTAASDIFTPDTAMDDLLGRLAATDLPLILVSNTSRPHVDFVRRTYNVLSHFDRLILSYEVKAAKPEHAFYAAAFEAAGCEPGDCFYTDDIVDYIAAASDLGVDAVHFQSAAQIERELTARGVL